MQCNTCGAPVENGKCTYCGKVFFGEQAAEASPHVVPEPEKVEKKQKSSRKLTKCKVCQAEIAKSAKRCPNCGAKLKKPLYKKWWFWLVLLCLIGGGVSSSNNDTGKTNHTSTPAFERSWEDTLSKENETHSAENTQQADQSTQQVNESPSESSSAPDTQEETPKTVNGMRPEFKKAMDDYEAFYDEYCKFMKKYSENPSDLSLFSQYAEILTKMEKMDASFEKWDDGTMNDAELKYYLEVNGRVLQKLSSIA